MNRHLKKELRGAFEAPKPDAAAKERFLNDFPQPKLSMRQFVLIQMGYMRKWVLILSVLLLLTAAVGAYSLDKNTLWFVSAATPFLGLAAVTESSRSAMYGMSELEMAARFSLKSVVLARMSILGFVDFIVLMCITPLCFVSSRLTLVQTAAYILVPYLLTVNISLWITRCFHGREAFYGCISAAMAVSAANLLLRTTAELIYHLTYIRFWIIAAFILICCMIGQVYKTIKQTEEYVWNL